MRQVKRIVRDKVYDASTHVPDNSRNVNVYFETTPILGEWYGAAYLDSYWSSEHSGKRIAIHVTHWREMPAPPRVGRK